MPTDLTSLVVALMAIVPGYITTLFWSRSRVRRTAGSDLITVLQSLALSLVIQASLSWLTVWLFLPVRSSLLSYDAWKIVLWLVVVVLIAPPTLGFALAQAEDYLFPSRAPEKLSKGQRLARVVWPPSPPTAWDWVFRDVIPENSFVIVEWSDGSFAAGTWQAGSMATTTPEAHGLWLAEEWTVDAAGNVVQKVAGTHGILIPLDTDIRKVRIVK